jgi:hypothetical protein
MPTAWQEVEMERADWLDDWLADELGDELDERFDNTGQEFDTAGQETRMERTDWLDEGFDSAQARFLLVTAITHHRFNSPIWGEHEVRKLHEELAEIDSAALETASAYQMRRHLF